MKQFTVHSYQFTVKNIVLALLFIVPFSVLNIITPVHAATDPREVFGEITPPKEIQPLINKGGQGAGGISLFLSNLVTLLYEIAAIAVTLYLVWGALEWILSGGEKEKVANAQKRITHALIGFVLMSIAFAILKVLGIFTGFTNFLG